jgi:hypothetical protein
MLGGGIEREQDLAIPVAVAAEPAMPLLIGGESGQVCQGEGGTNSKVDELNVPVGIFFGERAEQAEQTGMGGMTGLGGMEDAGLTGDDGPMQGLTGITEKEEGFD